MKTTGTTLRQSFVSAHPLTVALGGGVLALGLALAGASLLRSPEPAALAPAESGASARPALVYDATGAMQAAMGPSSGEASRAARPAPVYDATGAMLAAVEQPDAALTVSGAKHVYDATAAMLDALAVEAVAAPSHRPAPVYDATAAMLAALSSNPAQASRQFAPVYDATAAMWEAVPSLRP